MRRSLSIPFSLVALLLMFIAKPSIAADGCDPKSSRKDRLAVLDKVIASAKKEIDVDLPSLEAKMEKDDFRDRVATFAAGSIDDEIAFVALDRVCWAHFFEAKNELEDQRDEQAHDSSDRWHMCLAATFPERVKLAKPYYSCFPATAAAAEKNKSAK